MKPIGYFFRDEFYKCDTATDAFVNIFEKLAEYDETFLSGFENSRSNNKTLKRHLISKNRDNLYVASPHLIELSRQMKSNYWIATDNNTDEKISFIKDACGLIGLKYGKDLRVTFEAQDTPQKSYECNESTRIFVNAANEKISPYDASRDEIYFCAYCKCFSFVRETKDGKKHFYHKRKPNIDCPQFVGGNEFEGGDSIDHGIDYEKRLRKTINQLRENGNESWLDGQIDEEKVLLYLFGKLASNANNYSIDLIDKTIQSKIKGLNTIPEYKEDSRGRIFKPCNRKEAENSLNGFINRCMDDIIKIHGNFPEPFFNVILNRQFGANILERYYKYFSQNQIDILKRSKIYKNIIERYDYRISQLIR